MKIYIPAWYYRASAVIQRTWGWSPAEEAVLLLLDKSPGTTEALAISMSMPHQLISAALARLMQYGLVEIQVAPEAAFKTSEVGKEFLRSGRPLPERTESREIGIGLIYEKLGHSLFRNRNVKTVPLHALRNDGMIVTFPENGSSETDMSMSYRVSRFLASSLRPGEWLQGIEAMSSSIQAKYLVMDLEMCNDGVFPEGTSDMLVATLREAIKTGVPPELANMESSSSPKETTIDTVLNPNQIIAGGIQHLERMEAIIDVAQHDVFILSTFVASQEDERGEDNRERVWQALERACRRGVYCHLFFGTTDQPTKHAAAIEGLGQRLDGHMRGGPLRYSPTAHQCLISG